MPKCGAKTRSGGPCQRNAAVGGKRCKLHGGASTGAKNASRPGNGNAIKPGGLYSQYMTPEEVAQYDALELGAVDHELRLTRIRLSRALAAEAAAAGQPELDEVTENDGGGEVVPRETRKSKVRDYTAIIDRLTARIESLEKTRKALDGGEGLNAEIGAFEVVEYD